MSVVFRNQAYASDPLYLKIRDDPFLEADRAAIEGMWKRFSPYADRNFLSEIPREFVSRYWEMFVGCAMLDAEMSLSKEEAGPDLHVSQGGRLCMYLEATAPGGGTGPDRVDEPVGASFWVPHDDISLRLAGALQTKCKKHQEDTSAGRVDPAVPFVVALNPCRMWVAQFRPEQAVMRLLYGTEPDALIETYRSDSSEPVTRGYCGQSTMTKRSTGTEIRTGLFFGQGFADVSAVLFGCTPVSSMTTEPLSELMLLHNTNAGHPLPKKWLPVSAEAWVEDGVVKLVRRRSA